MLPRNGRRSECMAFCMIKQVTFKNVAGGRAAPNLLINELRLQERHSA